MAGNDGEINVEITGKSDGLDSALDDAANKVADWGSGLEDAAGKVGDFNDKLEESGNKTQSWGDKLVDAFNNVKGGGGDLSSWISGFAGGVLGGELVEAAEKAIGALKALVEEFYELGAKAAEFGEQNKIVAQELGLTNQAAASLQVSLQSVGISSESYVGMVFRLEMRLRTQEQAFKDLGITTRDASGDLLDGKTILDNLISTMDATANATERNQIALQALGRGAKEVYQIMRDNAAVQQAANDALKDWGYNADVGAQQGEAFALAVAKLWDDTKAFALSIGEELLPSLTDWASAVAGPLHDALVGLGAVILEIIRLIDVLVAAFSASITIASGAISAMTNTMQGVAHSVQQAVGGDAKGAWETFGQTGSANVKIIKDAYQSLLDTNAKLGTELDATFGKFKSAADASKDSEQHTVGKDDPKVWEDHIKANEIIAKSDEEHYLADIKMSEDANNQKLHMHQESIAQWKKDEIDLADASAAAKKKALVESSKDDAQDSVSHAKHLEELRKIDDAHIAEIQKINEKASSDQMALDEKAVKAHAEAAKAAAKASAEARKEETQTFMLEHDAQLANGIHALELEYQQGKITEAQKVELEKSLTKEIKEEELKRIDDELATLTAGTAEWNKVYTERLRIAKEMYKELDQVVKASAKSGSDTWAGMAKSDFSTFTQSLNGMIMGTTSWAKALTSVIDGVAENFLKMIEKNVENWLFGETTKAAISKTQEGESAISQITAAAGVAGANTFASTTAIPIVGPELAPAAAAASVSSTMAFSSLAFAEKGMQVDRDRLVFAHKDEQILPSNIANGLTNMINNGGANSKNNNSQPSGKSFGDVHLHVHPLDGQSFMSFMKSKGDELSKLVSSTFDRNPSLRPSY